MVNRMRNTVDECDDGSSLIKDEEEKGSWQTNIVWVTFLWLCVCWLWWLWLTALSINCVKVSYHLPDGSVGVFSCCGNQLQRLCRQTDTGEILMTSLISCVQRLTESLQQEFRSQYVLTSLSWLCCFLPFCLVSSSAPVGHTHTFSGSLFQLEFFSLPDCPSPVSGT